MSKSYVGYGSRRRYIGKRGQYRRFHCGAHMKALGGRIYFCEKCGERKDLNR